MRLQSYLGNIHEITRDGGWRNTVGNPWQLGQRRLYASTGATADPFVFNPLLVRSSI
jgi:hypothetical protein